MQWWCAAQGLPWTWTWRAYPGVWLFVAAIALAWWRWSRRRGTTPAGTAYFLAGLLLLWVALDWPIGALGAGYLASVHMVQFLLIAFYAPPLLLLGLRASVGGEGRTAPVSRLRHRLIHPLLTLVLFVVATIATHLPVVTDNLMSNQAGSFAIDTAWVVAGLLFWWPVIMPGGPAGFVPIVRMGYLVASMVLMTAPNAMITFSDLPLYATFELAPPIPGVSVLQDQRLAGILMRFGSAVVIWTAISILFLRWNRQETRLMEEEMREQRKPDGARAG